MHKFRTKTELKERETLKHFNKNEEKFRFFIDLGKCIFCGNCEYYCPSKAMKMTNTFESPYTNKTNQIIELGNNRKV